MYTNTIFNFYIFTSVINELCRRPQNSASHLIFSHLVLKCCFGNCRTQFNFLNSLFMQHFYFVDVLHLFEDQI